MELIKHTTGPHSYFLSGPNPSVLFLSGMHGDEFGSGKILQAFLNTRAEDPHFLYIPKVSPSAIAQGTRANAQGHDINRQFRFGTEDAEAKSIMSIVSPYRFRIVIDIHEDPDRTQAFYVYDNARMTPQELALYRDAIHQTDARLYTGIDDLEDENLGCHVDRGYYSFRTDWDVDTDKDAGFFSKWAVTQGIAARVFTVEIPGKAPDSLKRQLIDAVVPFLTSTFAV